MLQQYQRLTEQLMRSAVPLIAIVAPAGYEKSLLARALAAETDVRFSASLDRGASAMDLADQLCAGIAAAIRDDSGEALTWHQHRGSSCIVIDDAAMLPYDVLRGLVLELLARRPRGGRIVVCAEHLPRNAFLDLINPHQLVVLRAQDLSLIPESLRELAREFGGIDESALYRILRMSQGWPEIAKYMVRRHAVGRLDANVPLRDPSAWTELLDWVQIHVIDRLPAELLECVAFCVSCTDAAPADLEQFREPGGPNPCDELSAHYQLADVGTTGEVRLLPPVYWFFKLRRAAAVKRAANDAAEQFLKAGDKVRAARVYINDGNLVAAEALYPEVTEDAFRIGFYAYPGAALEDHAIVKPPYVLYPSIWFGLLSCRQYFESESALALEGAQILESTPIHDPAAKQFMIARVATLFLQAGNRESGTRFLDMLDDSAGGTMGAVADFAHMFLDVMDGRFNDGFLRWKRCKKPISQYPVWFAAGASVIVRAALVNKQPELARETVRLLQGVVHHSASPLHTVTGLVESCYDAWVRNDSVTLERERTALRRSLLMYDLPSLWRMCGAFFCDDLRGKLSSTRLDEWRALLVLVSASSDPERRQSYAVAAIESADLHGWILPSISTRIMASVVIPQKRVTYLQEAMMRAEMTDSAPLQSTIAGYLANAASHEALVPAFAKVETILAGGAAVKVASSVREHLPALAELLIDVTSGTITRNGQPVPVSGRTLALVTFLSFSKMPPARDTVIDAMWPDLDAVAGLNALKMCVHRARAQLGDASAIEVRNGTYRLGPGISSNFASIVAAAERDAGAPLTPQQRSELETLLERLSSGHRSAWATWEWFAPHAERLAQATTAIGSALIRDALDRSAPLRALQLARYLIAADPIDELPRRLAIEAQIASGNPGRAFEEYREYERVLRQELDVKPSASLYALIRHSHAS